MTLQGRLEALREAVTAQAHRVAELERERDQAVARVGRAREALSEHYRQREREGVDSESITLPSADVMLGRDSGAPFGEFDPEEARLIGELREVEEGLTVRPVRYPLGGGVEDVGLEPVSPRAEAMLEGARELLEQRQGELRAFAEANLGGLAVERATRARELVAESVEALRQVRLAMFSYESERHWWTRLLNDAGRTEWLGSIPANPLEPIQGITGEIPPPIPDELIG